MFENNLKTEPIPERVYELCKYVSKGEISDKEMKEKIEPTSLKDSNTTYYYSIREVCINELKLVNQDGDILSYIGDKKIIKDMDSFRKYCNLVAYKNENSHFFKIANCFLESNDEWLKYTTLTDPNIIKYVRDKTGIRPVTDPMMLGMRFWMSFLGFGYIQEKEKILMWFLPNMHVALQDFCEASLLEKKKEYSVDEFMSIIYERASVALINTMDSHKFNLAMSNALRQMHDNKEIELKRQLDSKEVWNMFHDGSHEFTEEITHIVYKGVKRR
ncbi:hypothetical protein ACTQ31_08710 [Clostridium butyricum]|uniref:hypothetical protein n=1 Tax=Clostridium butyricum TaxID=1492 RepID=UPI003F8E0402